MYTKVWHDTFADDWMRAFPLGNGRIGAMFFGNPHKERIEINEESLWSGRQIKETCNCSPEALGKIRDLLFDNESDKALSLCDETFLANPPRVRFYESFGNLYIDFADKSSYKNYRKELELSDAVAKAYYEKCNVSYQSEAFVSEKYDVLVYKVSADNPFCCEITMEREQDAYTATVDKNTILLNGRITYDTHEWYGEGGEGMSFGAKIYVDSDGKLSARKNSICVEDATYVTIFSAFATNYNVSKYDIDENINYREKLDRDIEAAKSAGYDEIKNEHIKSHKDRFERVEFKIDAPDFEEIPTDERLRRIREEDKKDLGFYVLYYNFGRYLLTESSGKKATLPANLQGKWCSGFTPPWGSDYHTNINMQMNYWPAENANMSETMKPFIHFMKMVSEFGKLTAKNLFGARGWVINHTTDVFGRTGVHDGAEWGFFPMAGPWLCLNLWEHYEYTNDVEFLKEIYPILKGSCEFVEDFLTEDREEYLVTNPSNSPENSFYYTDKNGEKRSSMFTYGATIDFEIIYALYTRVIYACKKLNIDINFSERLQKILEKLPPLRVSERYGTICEWIKDYEEVEPGHRHISHLFGLFPGDQINETDETIYQAARNTIERRLTYGGGATGWSRAWIINFYARLKDGENALKHLNMLMKCSTAENLFDIHPPFQIDGNFGAVSGINEMLIQSHLGSPDERIIDILPALPKEWESGFVKGIKARGNFEIDIIWENGRPIRTKISSLCKNTLRLKINHEVKEVKTEKKYSIEKFVLKIELDKNETLEIFFA